MPKGTEVEVHSLAWVLDLSKVLKQVPREGNELCQKLGPESSAGFPLTPFMPTVVM